MKHKIDTLNPVPSLIKENVNILKTFTKIKSSNTEALVEEKAFKHIQKLNIKSPKIIFRQGKILTTQYISGLSVFEALKYFSQKNQLQKIDQLLEDLCESLLFFQKNSQTLKNNLNIKPYNVRKKILEVADVMDITNTFDSKPLRSNINKIKKIYDDKANTLFRDATPKNYILKDITIKNLKNIKNFTKHIYWIDFSSINQLTFLCDDFISILYHYMIDDKKRTYFMNKYHIHLNNKENIISAFVRLSRFWVRRAYYNKFYSKSYIKRYNHEDITFYEKNFSLLYNQINKIL